MNNSGKTTLLIIVNFNQHIEVERFLTHVLKVWKSEDLIVVDDGSSDDSDNIIEKMGLPLIRHEKNRGIGAAIRTGINHAKELGYPNVVIMSSNGKMNPDELARIVAPLHSGEADYVTGSRFLEGGGSIALPPFRRFAMPIFNFILNTLLGRKFSDITCGFRAYKIDFLFGPKANIQQSWLDRYELEYYIHYWASVLGLRIKEVPVTIRYDHLHSDRQSKITPLIGWWSMARPILLLRLKIKN